MIILEPQSAKQQITSPLQTEKKGKRKQKKTKEQFAILLSWEHLVSFNACRARPWSLRFRRFLAWGHDFLGLEFIGGVGRYPGEFGDKGLAPEGTISG
jgi:hypothetical protein